ncbi:YDG domain-containing protein [Sphingomonas sp.]|uniref:YDG domain-containing protein n=1 Tax=Sphingomonas sp. TaxID=28214 RepID=UPI002E1348B5|nr:YDG domain-containing protein [Sphingomonas sp.]
MTKSIRLRTALSATTILAAGLIVAAAPARAQNLPDTGNVTAVTSGLSGGAPGSTNPTFTTTGDTSGPQTLQIDLKDNRTILTWSGTGFDVLGGSTVNFKDARATSGVSGRTDNIAVLNRDISGGASSIYGILRSDPNVAVYVINRAGIVLGGGSDSANTVVNTGAFFASTNDITNDNDFLNGSSSLRFGVTGESGEIEIYSGARIRTAANNGGSGGRMGDIGLIAQSIRAPVNAGLVANGGDVALVLASDVTVQNAPGSPLSLTIHRGAVGSQRGLTLRGEITGRNVTVATSHIQNGFGANITLGATIVATGASVTDRGVVLTAGASAPGVTMATEPSNVQGAPIGMSGGLILDSPTSISSTKSTILSAVGDVTLFTDLNLAGSLLIRAADVRGSGMASAKDIRIDATLLSGPRFRTTEGDMILNLGTGGGNIAAAEIAGNLTVDSLGGITLGGPYSNGVSTTTGSVTVGGSVSITSLGIGGTALEAGGDVSLTSKIDMIYGTHIGISRVASETGSITMRASGRISAESITGADLDLRAAGDIQVDKLVGKNIAVVAGGKIFLREDIFADGNLSVSGNGVFLGQDMGRTINQNATGAITINAGTGLIDGAANLSVLANSDGVGAEALTLISTAGLSFNATSALLAGPNRQSDIYIRTNASAFDYDITLGKVAARSLFGAYGSAEFTGGLTRNSRIWFVGPSTFTNSLSLDGHTVWVDNIQITNGDLSLRSREAVGVVRGPTSASGDILIRSDATTGGMYILSTGRLTASNVILSTPWSFSNQAGSNAINASSRWIVYARSPGISSFGNLDSGNTALWGATIESRAPDLVTGSRYVFSEQPTLTFSTVNFSKIYGTDLTGSTQIPYTVSGFRPGVAGAFLGDSAATAFSGNPLIQSAGYAERASVAGGAYTQTIALGSLQSDSGYRFAFASGGRVTVTPKTVTGSIVADNKTYNGNTTGSGSVSLVGVLAGDSVGTSGSVFTFADKNAGTGKTVNVTGTTLNGADSGNYTLTIPASALADILKKAITGTITADSKTYDGTTAGTGSVALNGVIAGDAVGTTGSVFTFADKNAGASKTVTVTGTTLNGVDGGNYTLTLPASALADILQKALTATVTVNGKTYDGTAAATGTVALNGVVSGDNVGTTGSVFTFADKNAGIGRTVNVTGTTLNGADSGNYTLTVPASALADILQKALTANVTANGKTYDGTTTATGSVALSGVVAGDSVSTGGITFTFGDKNAGAGKAVAVGGAVSGADAANYTVSLPATVLADIIKKSLTATVTANGKTYDGTTAGTGSVALNGVVSGDVVSTGGITFTFADKNAGTGKAVAVGGALSGADAGNYTVNLPASALADILKKALSATITINGKTYDGTTAATGSVALNGVVAGDTVGTSGTAFAFTDKNAGTGKTVNVSGTTLTGTDSGNYTLTIPASVLADIAKRGLSLSADDKEKYSRDPDPALTYTITLGSLVAGDQLSGALTRADGETPGKYAINQGSLSAGDNYTLTFTPGTLTISVDPATNQPQALRTLPLPSGIQAPPTGGSTVNVDAEALCADDSSCVAN